MFRKIYRPSLFAALAIPVFAMSAFAAQIIDHPPADAELDQRAPAPADVRMLSTHDYVQTELDWRSYYLNRQPGRFGEFSRDSQGRSGSGWLQQPAADGS